MGESVRKFGVDGKKRFTVKYPDGRIERYGTCNPEEDERMDIVLIDGNYWLCKYEKDVYGTPVMRQPLPQNTLVCNGYYDYEHDEFVSPEYWSKNT